MPNLDLSNPDLLRSIDPIRKAVYDEEGAAKFHIGHMHDAPPADLFGWADKERGGKASYELVGLPEEGNEQWELDVKPLISTSKWLNVHGLQRCRLTLKQILSAIGFKHNEEYVQTLGRPVGSFYGQGLFQQFKRKDGQLYNITVGREKLKKIEEGLLRAAHLYKRRMQWLTTGSRRIFGVIQEHCICFVIDVTTMSQTQFDLYREALCDVIREQVSQLAKFNMIKAQADMQMWQEQAMPVTEVTMKSALEWVNKLDRMAESSRTGCAEAIMRAMEDDSLESVYLFAEGDSCELSKELLRQKLVDAPHVLHTVSFNASKSGTIKFLREVASQTAGRFHAFVVKNIHEDDAEALPNSAAPPGGDANRISNRYAQKARGGIPAGAGVREDVFKIWSELEECRNNHAQVVTLLTEIPDPKTETGTIVRPAITDGKRLEQYMSSKEWLQRHGLEARKLTAFHALASCSFKHSDGVVDLKGKPGPNNASSDAENMRKLVNAKYCEQFAHTQWKDGTLVHVHITAEQHRVYEKRMGTALDAIQKRIDWLQQGSREVFGTILEEQVYILIDTSLSMQDKLSMVKEKLFQLMQEQLRHKNKFNFVKFDTKAVAWKDRACDVTEQNLLNAWNWVKDIGVGGSTNTLAALRIALSDPYTHAIYLLTDGRPDQQPRSVLAQVQLQHPVPIHTIAFNCNDLEANQFLHQLSSDTGGRYHNFTSNGSLPESPPPFESEDVSLLKRELDNGKRDLEKVSKLRARCVMLDWYHNKMNKNMKSPVPSESSKEAFSTPSRRQHRSLSRPKRPSSALSRRDHSAHSDSFSQRPHTSLGHYSHPSPPSPSSPTMEIAHKHHRGHSGSNDSIISSQSRARQSKSKGRQAGHTRTSMLRLNGPTKSHGWMIPETEEFYLRQIDKSVEALQDLTKLKIEKKKSPKKKKKINPLDISNSVWLKKHGLIARKLTIMDVLSPTVIRVKPKYIPVLDRHVVSKVFNDVMPIAHVSPRNKREIRLVNPAAVDLPGYDVKLKAAIEEFHNRLNLQVWKKLSKEEQDGLGDEPVSYIDQQDAIHQAFDRLGWPIQEEELHVLVAEIEQGKKYLQQSQDLQNTAKKVAMRGKKGGDEDSSSESSSSSDPSEHPPNILSVVLEDKPHQPLRMDRFKNQKVVARNEVDGFYYSGTSKKCTDSRHALITFKYGEEVIIPIRFVFLRTGAVSCPPLQIGDRVLAYSKSDSNVSCYVPGIVIGVPSRSQVRDKFYTVLKYNNTKTSLLRKKLIKISETRYTFAVRYIERASVTDPTIPSVDFIPPEPPREPDYVDEMRSSLQDLQAMLDDNCKEQQHQRGLLDEHQRQLERTRNELPELAQKMREMSSRDISSNTDPMTRDMSTCTEPLTPETVKTSPSTESTITDVTPIPEKPENAAPAVLSDDDNRTIVALNETKGSVMITKKDEGVYVSRDPPSVISPEDALQLPNGQELLARCTEDGWYYRGTVQKYYPDNSYDILDCTGFSQRTLREDIITDEDSADDVHQGDTVVAQHPSFPNSFAPGVVLDCLENDWFRVRFYDKEEANVLIEDVYLIKRAKHEKDVDGIIEIEKRWVGKSVVARSDMDGQYHLASCRSRVGNGHQYILQWPDGSSSTQHLSCMFDISNLNKSAAETRKIEEDDCLIALFDSKNLVYLPGRVMEKRGDSFLVNFCNRNKIKSVLPNQCFWISRQYYDLAVAFYNSKQRA